MPDAKPETTARQSKRPTQEMLDAIYAALGLAAPPIVSLESVIIEFSAGAIKIEEHKFVLEGEDAKA
jgi:hypothetical protein